VQCNLAFTRRRRAGALTESKAGKAARMKSMLDPDCPAGDNPYQY
jgi:hypothetical protein